MMRQFGREATVDQLLPLFLQLLNDDFPEARSTQRNMICGCAASVDVARPPLWQTRAIRACAAQSGSSLAYLITWIFS